MAEKKDETLRKLEEIEIEPESANSALQAVFDAAKSIEDNLEAALNWLSSAEPAEPRKVVVCVREDLSMSAGKVAAQTGHAIHSLCRECPAGAALSAWENEEYGSAIICLAVQNLQDLMQVRDDAISGGVPIFKIFDAGRTEVEAGTCTVMAVGPATNAELAPITGRLKLYKYIGFAFFKEISMLTIVSKSGSTLATVEAPQTVGDLKVSLAQKFGIDVNRVRLSLSEKILEPAEKPLSDFVSFKQATILFKDIGRQVGWRTVFLVEYAGPLVVMLAFLLWRFLTSRLSDFQVLGAVAYMAHFVKREMETIWVHRFSNETMPLMNIFANSGYYWGSAAVIAYFLTHPLYTPPPSAEIYWGAGIFLVSQALNFYTHLALAWLRPVGTKVRRVPRGFLFDQITCPNYTFEITAWVGFALMTRILAAWIFALVSLIILSKWAGGKKRRYLKEFDGLEGRDKFPGNRAVLFPIVF